MPWFQAPRDFVSRGSRISRFGAPAAPDSYRRIMSVRGHVRGWECEECGGCGVASAEQPLWMIDCDDCGEGPVTWANDRLIDALSIQGERDSSLDAPASITRIDLQIT
jgi:hypothetical protein